MEGQHFTTDCQRMAKLLDEGRSIKTLSEQFGKSKDNIRRMITVGRLPQPILSLLRENDFWTLAKVRDILVLRSDPDYNELKKVIAIAKSGKKVTNKKTLRQYVRRRKIEVEVEKKLNENFQREKQELEKKYAQELNEARKENVKNVASDIQHFARMCHDFDAILSIIVYGQLGLMSKHQIDIIANHTAWLLNELQKLSVIIIEHQEKNTNEDHGLRIIQS